MADQNPNIINIHGKQYMTVAGRVDMAHSKNATGFDLNTEVLSHDPVVVVKATVKIGDRTYTGISSANPAKAIEKSNPYEVAETSAVGRALGFAGYGRIESIATADDMARATKIVDRGDGYTREQEDMAEAVDSAPPVVNLPADYCDLHKKPMKERPNGTIDHRLQIDGVWNTCRGQGYTAQKGGTNAN